jgi:Uma2 family endonuclease
MATESSAEQPQAWLIPPELRLPLLAALAAGPNPVTKITFEDFLAWSDEDTRAEWVDGAIEMPSPASARRQQITQFLVQVIAAFLRVRPLGSLVEAPFLMKLAQSAREPDLLFVAANHRDRLTPTYLDGPADLVVEVVSPESAARDRGEKFYEYQAAGIPEYWLIDPRTEHAEFYQLTTKGVYEVVPLDADGKYHSKALPGLWLRVSWLWQDPSPDPDDVLLEMLGEEYARHLIERLRKHGFGGDETP